MIKSYYFVVDTDCQMSISVDLRYGFVHEQDLVPSQINES